MASRSLPRLILACFLNDLLKGERFEQIASALVKLGHELNPETQNKIGMNVVKIIMYEVMYHQIRIMVPTVAPPPCGRPSCHCYTNVKLRRNFFKAFYSILSMVTVERFQCQLSHMTLKTAYCTSGMHGQI